MQWCANSRKRKTNLCSNHFFCMPQSENVFPRKPATDNLAVFSVAGGNVFHLFVAATKVLTSRKSHRRSPGQSS